MGDFETAVRFAMYGAKGWKGEGGYVNDKDDRGGPTNYGISSKTFDDAKKQGIINARSVKNITQEDARSIYKQMFWDKISGNQLPSPLSAVLFDTAVNNGVTGAVKMLQGVVGINSNGIMGKETLAAIKNYKGDVADDLIEARRVKYAAIVKRNPTQAKYYKGWINRVDALKKFSNELKQSERQTVADLTKNQSEHKGSKRPLGERIKESFIASSAVELAESENAVIASKTLSERLSSMVSGITDFFSKSKSEDYATKNTTVKKSATVKPEVRSSKNGADSKDHDKAARLNADLEAKEGLIIQEVKDGDTLGIIAKEHGRTVDDIMDVNPQIKDKNLLYAGEKIYLPQNGGIREHNEEHAKHRGGLDGASENDEWAKEFKKLVPDATPDQLERAGAISAAAREILSNSNKNPTEQAEALELFHRNIAENIKTGKELPPVQIYDPNAEPTRVVRAFTLEEIQKQQGQEMGIQKQRSMEYGAWNIGHRIRQTIFLDVSIQLSQKNINILKQNVRAYRL